MNYVLFAKSSGNMAAISFFRRHSLSFADSFEQYLFDEVPAVAVSQAPDDLLDPGDHIGVHGELVQVEAQEYGHVERLARHFPAQGDLYLPGVRVVHRLLDHPEHGGVERLVEIGDVFVDPVYGQGVLDQVVRADAEEIDLLGEEVGDHRGGGHLDHDADL